MNKYEFLGTLKKKLSGLPQREVDERLNFYSEMIDDRVEDGCSEEDAVSAIGSVDQVASQIIADIPLAKIAMEKVKITRPLKAWEIVLLALVSPILWAFVIALVAVIFSVYVVAWSLIVALWLVFVSLVACALGGVVAGIIFAIRGYVDAGIVVISVGIFCAGLAILLYFGCKSATKGVVKLTSEFAVSIKKIFIKKESE